MFIRERGDLSPVDGAPAPARTIRTSHDPDEVVTALEERGEDWGAEGR